MASQLAVSKWLTLRLDSFIYIKYRERVYMYIDIYIYIDIHVYMYTCVYAEKSYTHVAI